MAACSRLLRLFLVFWIVPASGSLASLDRIVVSPLIGFHAECSGWGGLYCRCGLAHDAGQRAVMRLQRAGMRLRGGRKGPQSYVYDELLGMKVPLRKFRPTPRKRIPEQKNIEDDDWWDITQRVPFDSFRGKVCLGIRSFRWALSFTKEKEFAHGFLSLRLLPPFRA